MQDTKNEHILNGLVPDWDSWHEKNTYGLNRWIHLSVYDLLVYPFFIINNTKN